MNPCQVCGTSEGVKLYMYRYSLEGWFCEECRKDNK